MHVLIAGYGAYVKELVARLGDDDHEIAVMAETQAAFADLSLGSECEKVVGIAYVRDHLKRAGIESADAFIAQTDSDNTNVVAARIAHDSFRVPRVVAGVRDPAKARVFSRLGIATVSSVEWVVDQTLRSITDASIETDWEDPTGALSLVSHALPVAWAGRRLANLNEPGKFTPVSITRAGTARFFEDDLVGQEGDVVHLLIASGKIRELEKRLEHPEDYA